MASAFTGRNATEVAAANSEISENLEEVDDKERIRIDEITGAIEDSACIDDDDMPVSKESKVRFYKNKQQLKKDVEIKKQAIHRVFQKMRYAEEVDLCFLVDCTGSMDSYLKRIKETIKTWFERLRGNYKHLELRVSFVRYTDFDQPKSTRTTWLDFTDDIGQFYSFVDAITTTKLVGGDTCEDVFGGLEAVPKLAWRDIGTKVLIHFADAPCHGKQYYNEGVRDNYPGGDPGHRNLSEIMYKFYQHEIYYYFGYIKKQATSKMIEEFDMVLCKSSEEEMAIQTFNAERPLLIDEAVYRSISTSISASVEKMSAVGNPKGKICDLKIMPSIPEWDEIETQSVKMSKEISTSVDLPTIPTEVKLAKQPFAKGAMKYAYHGLIPEENKHVVLKKFVSTAQTSLRRYAESSLVQGTAASYAALFNQEKPPGMGIEMEFTVCGIMECPEDTGDKKAHYYSYEPYIHGDYIKFNSNVGYVSNEADPVNDTCQAFSHYTWVKSKRELLVCDIQGVKEGTKLLLTDPAIHCKNILKFGGTNLGVRGMKKFFESHKCNDICEAMRLVKSQHQRT